MCVWRIIVKQKKINDSEDEAESRQRFLHATAGAGTGLVSLTHQTL